MFEVIDKISAGLEMKTLQTFYDDDVARKITRTHARMHARTHARTHAREHARTQDNIFFREKKKIRKGNKSKLELELLELVTLPELLALVTLPELLELSEISRRLGRNPWRWHHKCSRSKCRIPPHQIPHLCL